MIKNYTSQVPSSRSITYIEHRLVSNGARDIMKQYGPEGELTAICFTIEINGNKIPFKLPAKVERCFDILMAQVKRPQPNTKKIKKQQAERTAWKILADWVDIQMSLIELGQAEIMEIFLPYVYDAGKQQTFFERMKNNGFKLLPETV